MCISNTIQNNIMGQTDALKVLKNCKNLHEWIQIIIWNDV